MTLDVNWTSNLLIALIAWWISEGSNLVQELKFWLAKKEIWYINQKYLGGPKGEIITYRKDPRRLKPFDCPMCLAFWIGLFFNAIDTRDLLLTIVYAILCSSIAIFISKIYNRL